jgi:hypothetical protein
MIRARLSSVSRVLWVGAVAVALALVSGCGSEDGPASVSEPAAVPQARRSSPPPVPETPVSAPAQTAGSQPAGDPPPSPGRDLNRKIETLLDRAAEEENQLAGRPLSVDEAMRMSKTLWELENLAREAAGETASEGIRPAPNPR